MGTQDKPEAIEALAQPQQLMVLEPSRAPQRITVEEPIAVFDTARFEHMARIANVLAEGKMIPQTIYIENEKELPEKTVKARCFMIVNFAFNNRSDPFAVAQCASFVHGRLCWEGKLISSLLEERHGIVLDYEWNDKQGDAFGIVVSAIVNGKTLSVEGTVGDWKTTGRGSPWGSQVKNRKMLAYRGAREWARLYKPSTMTGILADDEVDAATQWRDSRPSLAQPATTLIQRLEARNAAETQQSGFDPAHVERETAGVSQEAPTEPEDGPGDADVVTVGDELAATADEAHSGEDDGFPGDAPEIAPRYFYHPESDDLIMTADGSHPGDPLVEEISGEDYERLGAEQQRVRELQEPPEAPPPPVEAPKPAPAKRAAAKEPPIPTRKDIYIAYAEQYIGNFEGEWEALKKRFSDERPHRTGKLNEPLNDTELDGLRALLSKRKDYLTLRRAGRA